MEHVICSCHRHEHHLFFEKDNETNIIYLSVHLNKLSFLKRFKLAIKYLFGYKSKYGEYEEFIIDNENYRKFKEIVNFFEKKPSHNN